MSKVITYPINEIFRSIQGEGYHAGRPAVFVRFAGCNLKCDWCDTDHSVKEHLDAKQLASAIQSLLQPYDIVVLTGGEPTLYDLMPLFTYYFHTCKNTLLAVETNGTTVSKWPDYFSVYVDWITVSPKMGHIIEASGAIRSASEIKVVLDNQMKPELVADLIPQDLFRQGRCYIQPCSENYQSAVDYVISHPWWRLGIQMHKVIGVR